jgi:DNA-binding NarL/FixJ family response regulator
MTLAHPLYGEILRHSMPMLRRHRLLLERAEGIEAHGARRREDPISIANIRLEVTGSADPRLLVRATRLARYGQDFPQVVRLGRAAAMDGMTPEIGLLVGEALHELGSFEEADEVLTAAEGVAADDDGLLVPLAEMQARNLMWGLFRPDEALEVNHAARRRLGARSGAVELALNEAMLLTYSGRPSDALAILDEVGDLESPRDRALRALAEVPSLIAIGQADRGVELAISSFVEHMQLPDQVAIPGPGIQILNQMYGLAESGRLAEAAALAATAYEGTPTTSPPDVLMWFAQQQGRDALLAGRLETAERWLAEAAARCEEHDIVGPRRLVLSALATARACRGDAAGATALAAELDGIPVFPFTQAEQELGRAWALAAAGDLAGARQVLLAAADQAAEAGYRSSEGWLLHDVARLGDPQAVAERLQALAAACEGELIATYALHAVAAAARDGEALVASADAFEHLGAMLLAAEAATDASQVFQRAGERRTAAALGVRAHNLAATCEGARTPALANPVMVVPLTARERDIASLAAAGVPSKDIADQLYLSVRTVNNHLQNTYSKLGVASRRDLAAALAKLSVNEDPPPVA